MTVCLLAVLIAAWHTTLALPDARITPGAIGASDSASVKRGAPLRARLDAQHKAAHRIVASADVIGLAELNLCGMTRSAKGTIEKPGINVAAKSGLNRSLLDAGFGKLATLIREKAEYAVRKVVSVNPRYSSQTCGVVCTSGGESSEKVLCVRLVWLYAARRRQRGVGDRTTSAVGAHE